MQYTDTPICNRLIISFRTAAMHFSNLLTIVKSLPSLLAGDREEAFVST